jgi:hypothetical protein
MARGSRGLARIEEEGDSGILGFWNSGIQEEKSTARGSRGLARIEEEEDRSVFSLIRVYPRADLSFL